ncbi:methyltransferase type 11 [Pleomorphomonas diazotrophica]|uniref:Methyltransferase type 11 n=1 Tax=Pleomorphomonas diazotrophica TaxID=1166257 RepID=A0A1I4WFJ8_9HYPH|nr:methyltransferase domain-containing protein [Pleomorphomonas diazotrophica]PKR88959.1 methyltransferase type 11 [Pleomorphomonas diazotrophica]SFN12207.1 Methyltransferase domain-containing protein [Pleomorphomonas diazotrophica]
MPHRCPWYLGYVLINPLRKLLQHPAKLLTPHVRPGFRVLEPGPGMGYFTLELARLVGPTGKVHVVDIEPRMLSALGRRAESKGLEKRIDMRLGRETSLGVGDLPGEIDFVLAFAVVHELGDAANFFREAAAAMKSGATLLLAEPAGHVSEALFAEECAAAKIAGLVAVDRPDIWRSHAAVFAKP